MLESFTIENYRSFKKFTLSQLGRVNLLVGENNGGKTSILEAIYLYSSYPKLNALLKILNCRGEFSWVEDDDFFTNSIDSPIKRMRKDFNIVSLFNEYNFNQGSYIDLSTLVNSRKNELRIYINHKHIQKKEETDSSDIFLNPQELFLEYSLTNTKENNKNPEFPVNNDGFLLFDSVKKNLIKGKISYKSNKQKTQFITLFEQDIDDLIEIFDDISLTPKEDIIIEAVRIIEPRIKRIATTKSERGEKGSFKVLLEGYEKPISIGTMGDGIWRLLSIALAMVNTQDGVLLIDEIDTGLHFTTLFKMWELILETSKKLNVQVFATTHNSDCWMALGELISQKNAEENGHKLLENEVTLHRIESNKNESVLFTAEQIAIAANREIEVR
jgi:hypothetical protein